MSWNETIDNYLYDEENEYTQADDLWDDFFVERRDEIDERPWNQADALAHRNELNKDGERKVNTLLQSALERLRYSDEILAIYKYLHR